MKILAIHNYHRSGSASGDDLVFKNETELLEKHGNQVIKYTVSNDEFDKVGLLGKVRATVGMLWNSRSYRQVKRIIQDEKPDIVHIHTFFPLLSPSVLYAAKKSGVTVVATLHDTRFICPCATSLCKREICNKCGDGKYLRMCRYKCFKNSKVQSFIIACIFKTHRLFKSFYKQIDKYICLNDNQINLMENIGFEKNKLVKKYNFVKDEMKGCTLGRNVNLPHRYVVFYGRIGEEKGIKNLINIWNELPEIPLVVMGGGPLEREFSKWSDKHENVYYLGYVNHKECINIVNLGEFVIFPSIWYEGCSMVEIESESMGKPLIATDLGFSHEAIRDGINGYKIANGDVDNFRECIKKLWNNPDAISEMGKNARIDYEKKYMPDDNYKQLINIYTNAIKNHNI